MKYLILLAILFTTINGDDIRRLLGDLGTVACACEADTKVTCDDAIEYDCECTAKQAGQTSCGTTCDPDATSDSALSSARVCGVDECTRVEYKDGTDNAQTTGYCAPTATPACVCAIDAEAFICADGALCKECATDETLCGVSCDPTDISGTECGDDDCNRVPLSGSVAGYCTPPSCAVGDTCDGCECEGSCDENKICQDRACTVGDSCGDNGKYDDSCTCVEDTTDTACDSCGSTQVCKEDECVECDTISDYCVNDEGKCDVCATDPDRCDTGQIEINGECVADPCIVDKCVSYTDGCNTCTCGDMRACTEMWCSPYGTAECTDCEEGYTIRDAECVAGDIEYDPCESLDENCALYDQCSVGCTCEAPFECKEKRNCFAESDAVCVGCTDGYELTERNTCEVCSDCGGCDIDDCEECETDMRCKSCADGYKLDCNGGCQPVQDNEDCDVIGFEPEEVEGITCNVCMTPRSAVTDYLDCNNGNPNRVCHAIKKLSDKYPEFVGVVDEELQCMLEYCAEENSDLENCELEQVRLRDGIETIGDFLSEGNCNCMAFECDYEFVVGSRGGVCRLGVFIGLIIVFTVVAWM